MAKQFKLIFPKVNQANLEEMEVKEALVEKEGR
jgi:hypothetical protein